MKFLVCYLIVYRHQPDQPSQLEDAVPGPILPSKVIVGIDVTSPRSNLLSRTRSYEIQYSTTVYFLIFCHSRKCRASWSIIIDDEIWRSPTCRYSLIIRHLPSECKHRSMIMRDCKGSASLQPLYCIINPFDRFFKTTSTYSRKKVLDRESSQGMWPTIPWLSKFIFHFTWGKRVIIMWIVWKAVESNRKQSLKFGLNLCCS